ncbi:efflux RND transporter permease subunit [Bacillus solimangrovi]|uniref:Acriflavin resistance protein n=1 Tax=Bacillus solimangrovi TaxID=1305675 RepID=A0A1E5LDL8_9BACI|nr:efflux RND transporter permease subunit [Bacillus solimangrovi]OEH92174.1 acriflavin resistance protein [Bacillus solimangrovi]
MKLVNVSVKRPVGVIMIVLSIIALGFISLRDLAVDLYPDVDFPIAVVATSYPGAAPEEVEKLLSKPIESAVSTIEGVDTIQSRSQPSSSLVVLQFTSGTDLDNAMIEVREKVDQVKGALPSDANDPSVLRFDPQQIPVMYLGLTGDKSEVLQKIAENDVQPYLERAEGVASVTVEGGKTREIQVEVDQAKLAQYGLTSAQVVQALGSENVSSSAGVISKGSQELQIRIEGEFESVDDIRNTLIPLQRGGDIKVRDVATVSDTFQDVNTISKVNGEDSVVLSALKQSDGNTIEVADALLKAMDKVNKELPEGVELSVVFDTSTFIRDSIKSVTNNMFIGGMLAIGVLFLFLRSFRATVIIGISIPIAIVSTFILMYFTGETVNILTMGGLALGIGMMVDSSIVILENVFRYRQNGASVKEAAIKGASELASAVVASTTTSLVVFLPIVYVQGLASDLFTPMALTVSFSLIASLVVSLTLIPMLASKLLNKPIIVESEQKGWYVRLFSKVTNVYRRMLNWVLGHRKTTILVTILAIVGSFVLAPQIGTEFIPASDQGQVQINLETPSGSKIETTEAVANRITKEMEPYRDIIETSYLSIATDVNTGLSGSANTGSFQILLISPDEREMTTEQFVNEMKERTGDIPGAEIVVSEMEAGLGTGAPISISISGPEQEVLTEISEQIVWLISDIEGVENPESSASEGRPEIQIDVNREVAAQFGLSYQEIMSQVELAFNGRIATFYREEGDEFDVRVMLPEDERSSISDLEQLTIRSQTGILVPLATVAELKQIEGPAQISRENQERQVQVTSSIKGRDLGSVTADINTVLATMNFPEGYDYKFGGQSEDMAESFQDLALALIFSIFLVYTVMAVQFESFVYPFIIMFAMPTMLVGILVGLFITGQPFSIPAFIGIIMLAGIVVNNAIVLVDYINILREQGYDRIEAILKAGPTRVRPILMTTLTTVLGMVPLALGFGEGGEAQVPMAVVVIFGLSTSTLFTLLLIPVMYTYVDDVSRWSKRLFGKIRNKFKRKKNKTVTE